MLSPREQDAYEFIRRFFAEHGRAPLLREIARGLGLRSRGVVHRYVQALERERLVERTPGRHRGIRIAARGRAVRVPVLPLLGRVAAGRPIEAIPEQEEVDLAAFFTGPGRFVLKVRGESMVEAGILDGDMVVVDSRRTAADGDIVVALLDGEEATLKRIRHNPDGSVTLIPANRKLAAVTYGPGRVEIQGVIVGQMRSYR